MSDIRVYCVYKCKSGRVMFCYKPMPLDTVYPSDIDINI